MQQSIAMQKKSKRSETGMVRERGTFSYDPSAISPDLMEQIEQLAKMEDSPYWNRSLSSIAGMILMKAVPKEIQKYEKGDSR
jgi:hypothetical protein